MAGLTSHTSPVQRGRLGDVALIVGDDYLATNDERIRRTNRQVELEALVPSCLWRRRHAEPRLVGVT